MQTLDETLKISASRHTHLCPRQVLGIRIGVAGASALGLDVPRKDQRLLVIIETDGCFADGIESSTGSTVGHRTLRIEDFGKIAASFVDVETEQAFRITPQPDARQRAFDFARDEPRHYFAQLVAYQSMPAEELLTIQEVRLVIPVQQLVSRPGIRALCEQCGEEIINEREVVFNGNVLCRACSGAGYYSPCHVIHPINYLLRNELVK
ncbi:MAG: FmdE family protein [Chloroflexi bacterium]|nr:FmdE family protein [Chloroflexota bacterium]